MADTEYTRERLRALMAQAAAAPGTAVEIPSDLVAAISGEIAAQCRQEIIAIRKRECLLSRDGIAALPSASLGEQREPIPERVFWALLADNFYSAAGNGMGLEFYRKWKPRRAEFPQGESAGWGRGSAHNPFKDPPLAASPASKGAGGGDTSKPTNAEVAEWAERHDLRGSATDLRCAFEDAQTLHMTHGVPGTSNDQQKGGA